MYGLFNTRTFSVVSVYIVTNPFIIGFDIIQALSRPTAVISKHLDLTLLYADWTCQEINSLTHSHLVVLILFL